MINAAILGNGIIAQAHWEGYRILREEGFPVRVTAVCDIRPERLAGLEGVNTYTDVDEMLAKEKNLDFVDSCLPTFLHAPMAIKCMEAGLHVMSEKPMALTEEEAAAMTQCAKRTGKNLMIAHCMRFYEPMQVIRRHIIDQTLGKPQSAFFVRPDGRPKGRWNEWMWDEKLSGGAILDLQAHDIDIMCWFFGLPRYVSAAAANRNPGAGYETVVANHFYEGGLIANTYTDWSVPHNRHLNRMVRVNFEHGYIYNQRGSGGNVLAMVDENGQVTDLLDGLEMKNFTRNEIEYFASQIMQERDVRFNPPESTADSIRVIRAQMKSAAQNGAPVELV